MEELLRKQRLMQIYSPAFKDLKTLGEKRDLAWSGDVWWKHFSQMERPPSLSEKTALRLKDARRGEVDLASPARWKAFRLDATHASTAIEGNRLTRDQVAACLDAATDAAPPGDIRDIREVVNHAAALDYMKTHNLFAANSPPVLLHISQIFRRVVPKNADDDVVVGVPREDLRPDHGEYRRCTVKVTGSPTVQPYPHEVPALMERAVAVHNKHLLGGVDPIVAAVTFSMNFLHVHPFHDGNGRVSRLLLQALLYRHGAHACIIPLADRDEYFGHLHTYFEKGQVDGAVAYVLDKIKGGAAPPP